MATVAGSFSIGDNRAHSISVQWANLLNGDDGAPWDTAGPPRTLFVSVRGTFGIGGSVTLQGSADGLTWAELSQIGGAAATFTAAASVGVLGNPRFIRPIVTAGDGSTSLTVVVYATSQVG